MSADIDIDFADRETVLKLIQHTPARQSNGRKHNSGIYVTDIPRDPFNNCAALDYETAEQRGYFKLDFLNMSVYQLVKDPAHYESMLITTPPWERLWTDREWARQLVHVGQYSKLLESMKPDNIQRLAAFISIIRTGKAHLQNKTWSQEFASVWDGDNSEGFILKKSHAISYSVLVTLHMNLLNDVN